MDGRRGAPLQRTGAHILGAGSGSASASGGSRPPSSAASSVGGRLGGRHVATPQSTASANFEQFEHPPAPPSASRRGRLWQSESCPQLTPHAQPAQNVPTIRTVKIRPVRNTAEQVPHCVWSDSVMHLGTEDSWPAHAIPLFVFCGDGPPRPAYREQIKFTVSEDKYVNYGLRLRCGGGDRHAGGTIGLLHSPNRQEALPGEEGQLVTVTDILVMPSGSIVVSCVGDLPFRVQRTWMPRGFGGLQVATVMVEPTAPSLDHIYDTCESESLLARFSRLVQDNAPGIAALLAGGGGHYTLFCPTADILDAAFGSLQLTDESAKAEAEALLACHVVRGKVPCEALYNGRALCAIDGTQLIVTFGKFPRGDPRVNGIPIEHLDVMCANGVIHTISGLLTPRPGPTRRGSLEPPLADFRASRRGCVA